MKAAALIALVLVASTSRTQMPRDAPAVPQSGTALVGGIVTVDDGTRRPLRRALVTLTGTAGARSIVTDDAGRFAFPNLPAGRYTITAEKPAYVKTFFGSKGIGRGPGTPVAVGDGEHVSNLDVRILPGAALAGTVRDEFGNPLASAQVSVSSVMVLNGQRQTAGVTGVNRAATDDRGQYRLYGLPPGDYVVSAAAVTGSGGAPMPQTSGSDVEEALRALQMPTVPGRPLDTPRFSTEPPRVVYDAGYYPAATEVATAEILKLAAGEERTGLDIRISTIRAVRVEGKTVGPQGEPLRNVVVGMANVSTGSIWASPGFIDPRQDGTFVLSSITSGRYLIFGTGGEGTDRTGPRLWWTETEFVVTDRDVTGVVVQFLPGATVSGRLEFREAPAPADLAAARIVLTALPTIANASVGPPAVEVDGEGRFTFAGVGPGKYRLSVQRITGWSLRSAAVDGRDTLDAPLEVAAGRDVTNVQLTMTNRMSSIAGTLVDQLGRPTPEFGVVVFSTDRALWSTAPRRNSGLVKIGSDGRFIVPNLAPGEYYLAAVVDALPAQLSDPSFLELLAASAVRVTVGESEEKIQNLQLGR